MAKPEDASRSANIFDVARLAGVSHQTVSRVLNDSPSVRDSTRERVRHAIKQLRYEPSPAARALVTRRSRTLGMLTAGSADFGPASIQVHFNDAASAARYAVLTATAAESDVLAARTALEALLRQNVEAVLLVLLNASTLEGLRSLDLGVPVVAIAAGAGRGPLTVSIDQYGGARAAVRHLLDAGYREIVHVAGPTDHPDAQERLRGWADELASSGVARGPLYQADWTSATGHRVGMDLLVQPGRTGVFAGNDQTALGVMAALTKRGIRIPDEVGIVGFDDVPEAEFYTPALSTVRQDFEALGRSALRRILDVIDDPGATLPIAPIPATLIVRSSSTTRPDAVGLDTAGDVADEPGDATALAERA
jgi:DNA-binding LacI/PurR family transcriptional regulator